MLFVDIRVITGFQTEKDIFKGRTKSLSLHLQNRKISKSFDEYCSKQAAARQNIGFPLKLN